MYTGIYRRWCAMFKCVFYCCLLAVVLCKKERKKLDLSPVDALKTYENYYVAEIEVKTEEQLKWLTKFRKYDADFDFWRVPRTVGDKAHIMIREDNKESVETLLTDVGLKQNTEILFDNVDEQIGFQRSKFEKRRKDKSIRLKYEADDFHPNLMIEDQMKVMLSKQCPEGLKCDIYSIGTSTDGQDIKVFRIYKDEPDRNSYLVVSGLHARDWYSVSVNLQFASTMMAWFSLPEHYPNIQTLLKDGDWHFLFLANPDGYSYTWTDDRLWKKNRSPAAECRGVDLNANFDYNWQDSGHSNNQCTNSYKGKKAASEPETQAIQGEINRLGKSLRMVVNLEDYGPWIRIPWGKGQGSDNMDEETRFRYEMCKISMNKTAGIHQELGYEGNSCEPPAHQTGGDVTGYAHYVADVPHALDVAFTSDGRAFGYYPGRVYKDVFELTSVMVTSVYTVRGEEFPEFLVHDFDPMGMGKEEL